MKGNAFFKCFYILAVVILLLNVIASLVDEFGFSPEELPMGTLSGEFLSPSGDRKISVYRVENCLGVAVRAEYISLKDQNEHKNIYWQTDTDVIMVNWLNNRSVNINGVTLNVEGEYVYDSRRASSIFREGSLEGIAGDALINE